MKKTDLSYLFSMTGNDNKLIIEMIDIFIEQVNEIGIELNEACKNNNFDLIGKLAHKAKSSVSIMGMNKLSKKLNKLELLVNKGKKIAQYPSYIEYFNEECARAIEELTAYRSELSS